MAPCCPKAHFDIGKNKQSIWGWTGIIEFISFSHIKADFKDGPGTIIEQVD